MSTETHAQLIESADRRLVRILFAKLDWWICVAALVCGGLQVMNTQSVALFYVGMSMLTIYGLFSLARCVLTPDAITSWLVLASTLALGYGLGTLNTMLNGYSDYMSLLRLTYAPRADISESIALVLLLSALMQFISNIDSHKVFAIEQPILMRDEVLVVWLACATALAMLAMVATGQIGIQANVAVEEGSSHISATGAIVTSALSPMSAISVYFLAKVSGRNKMLLGLAIASILLVQATQGRRIFIFTLICCGIAYVASNRHRRLFSFKNIAGLSAAAVVVLAASHLFFAMRVATLEVGRDKNIFYLLEQGIKELKDQDRTGLAAQIQDNQDTRTFIIGYLAEILKITREKQTLDGALLELGVASAVPSVIWPGKWRIMSIGSEEALAHPQFGIPVWDSANSILTAGLCDYGLVGFFVYPLLIAFVFSMAIRAAMRLSLLARLTMAFTAVDALLAVENPFAGYTASLREVIILTVLVQLICYVALKYTTLGSAKFLEPCSGSRGSADAAPLPA